MPLSLDIYLAASTTNNLIDTHANINDDYLRHYKALRDIKS